MEFKTISLADRVFERLQMDILTGKYQIGEVISEKRLSEELGVSRTPIREALARLLEEDLIEDTPAGTVVMGMTDDDMKDIYEAKGRIETIAARRAALNITDEQIEKMKQLVDEQEFFVAKGDMGKVRDLDTEFHDVLYNASGSKILRRMLSPIHHKLMRYRKSSLEVNTERRLKSISEHAAIAEALAERDPDKAEQAVMTHIKNAFESVLSASENK
ncbi:MAG: GntR family transcriptional regulator [Eubacterium sp.]|nr:GntR family transcriptional regulator [Eubacterium sp.]